MLIGTRRLSKLSRDPYNSLITAIEPRPAAGSGPLTGLRYVAKDNICTKDVRTTCGSRILSDYRPPFSASVVSQLEDAGLVLVGKASMDEFGMGLSTMFSHYGATLNPRYAEKRISGGSSGGSAAAVAAGFADFALGTDTGGSVRQPASYCGIVGFKPSYGRVSRYGVVAYAQGLDCVGVFAPDVSTIRKVYRTLDTHDPKDITSMSLEVRGAVRAFLRSRPKERHLRIGIPREFLLTEVHDETLAQVEAVLHKLQALGHTVVATSIPSITRLLSAYYTLATVDAASNMSRFDGIRYGAGVRRSRADALVSGDTLLRKNRTAGLGAEVQRRLILGNYTLSADSGDIFYRANRLRAKVVEEFNQVFSMPNYLTSGSGTAYGCDILVGPTVAGRAPLMEEYAHQVQRNFLNEYLNDVYTVPASLAGLPAVTVPCENRDFGVQVIGQYGDDETVLAVAELICPKEIQTGPRR